MSTLELKIPPVLLVTLVGAAMLVTDTLLPYAKFAIKGGVLICSLLVLLGLGVIIAGVISFRRAQTTVDPRSPEAATAIVTTGIYRYSRNPMYVGFLVLLIAWATYLSNLFAYLLVPVFVAYMHYFQILPEERMLTNKFGEAYRQYHRSVRRWI